MEPFELQLKFIKLCGFDLFDKSIVSGTLKSIWFMSILLCLVISTVTGIYTTFDKFENFTGTIRIVSQVWIWIICITRMFMFRFYKDDIKNLIIDLRNMSDYCKKKV